MRKENALKLILQADLPVLFLCRDTAMADLGLPGHLLRSPEPWPLVFQNFAVSLLLNTVADSCNLFGILIASPFTEHVVHDRHSFMVIMVVTAERSNMHDLMRFFALAALLLSCS